MDAFSADELSRMRAAQDAAMMDTCELYDFGGGIVDVYGVPGEAYVLQGSSECGYDPNARIEVMEGTQVAITDAVLRLPIETEVTNLSRVKITHRYGEELETKPLYSVIGEPRTGPSGLLLNLRTVTRP